MKIKCFFLFRMLRDSVTKEAYGYRVQVSFIINWDNKAYLFFLPLIYSYFFGPGRDWFFITDYLTNSQFFSPMLELKLRKREKDQ